MTTSNSDILYSVYDRNKGRLLVSESDMECQISSIKSNLKGLENECIFSWDTNQADSEGLCQVNLVFAILLFYREGDWHVKKIAGVSYMKQEVQQIIYSTKLCRVKREDGTKITIPWTYLKPGESGIPTGIDKVLNMDANNHCFHPSRPNDYTLLDKLKDISSKIDDCLLMKGVIFPDFYLAVESKDKVTPRRNGDLIQVMQQSGSYDETKSLKENFHFCFDSCFAKWRDRWLIPWAWGGGKGTPIADLNSVERVYRIECSVDSLDVKQEFTAFEVRESL